MNEIPNALIQIGKHLNLPEFTTWKEAEVVFSKWKRAIGQERWDLKDIDLNSEQQQYVSKYLKELGFIEAKTPNNTFYEHGVILGATIPIMIARLQYLITQWNSGVRFKKLHFLVGERPLNNKNDCFPEAFYKLSPSLKVVFENEGSWPMHEGEAAILIYQFMELPEEMRKIQVFFHQASRKWDEESNQWGRPNTARTVEIWLENQPVKGDIVVVSTQPALPYQHLAIVNKMPDKVIVDTIASDCSEEVPMSLKIDSLYLWIKNH